MLNVTSLNEGISSAEDFANSRDGLVLNFYCPKSYIFAALVIFTEFQTEPLVTLYYFTLLKIRLLLGLAHTMLHWWCELEFRLKFSRNNQHAKTYAKIDVSAEFQT